MNTEDVLNAFRSAGALLENGHFILSSGRRSPVFLQKALVFSDPVVSARLCSALAEKLKARFGKIDAVCGPAVGGIIPGYETARALGCKAFYTERQDGVMTMRRGFSIAPGERVVIVEDIVTTGLSMRETISALQESEGVILGGACVVDRSNGAADVGLPLESLAQVDFPDYDPKDIPADMAAKEPVKPGSRGAEMTNPSVLRLGVNIDHVATIRNARGGSHPDPARAAALAREAGADGITIHLREDRRHIRDLDLEAVRNAGDLPINLEMAATEEMLDIALRFRPHAVCLVPEKREERTTEGGLDVARLHASLTGTIEKLKTAGSRVSLFIEPDIIQVAVAEAMGADVVELHTGKYVEHLFAGNSDLAEAELRRLRAAATDGAKRGLEIHAGHGLTYETVSAIAAIPEVKELNIGHFLMGEAIFIGLKNAIQRMRVLMDEARR